MNEKDRPREFPEVRLSLHGLDRDCDVSFLAKAAGGLASMLDEMGTAGQREEPPVYLYDWRKTGGRS